VSVPWWALIGIGVLLGWIFSRLPTWIMLFLLGLSVVMAGYLVSLGGLERAVAPLLAYAVALGLLVPAVTVVARSSRVAPPKRQVASQSVRRKERTTRRTGTKSGAGMQVTPLATASRSPVTRCSRRSAPAGWPPSTGRGAAATARSWR
jgi:hypothetical protein